MMELRHDRFSRLLHALPLTVYSRQYHPNGRGANLTTNVVTVNCQYCGKPADLVDGRFSLRNGNIVVEEAPLRSILIIAAIIAGQQIQDGRVREAELLEPLQTVPVQLRDILLSAFRMGGIKKYMGALLIAIGLMVAHTQTKIDATVDLNVLFDQLRTAITHEAPYPGLTHAEASQASPKESASSEAHAPSETAPSEAQKSKPSLSKRQQRRLRGQAKMQRKQTNRSSSPKKKC